MVATALSLRTAIAKVVSLLIIEEISKCCVRRGGGEERRGQREARG
jgi:hypothetical protein